MGNVYMRYQDPDAGAAAARRQQAEDLAYVYQHTGNKAEFIVRCKFEDISETDAEFYWWMLDCLHRDQ